MKPRELIRGIKKTEPYRRLREIAAIARDTDVPEPTAKRVGRLVEEINSEIDVRISGLSLEEREEFERILLIEMRAFCLVSDYFARIEAEKSAEQHVA